MKTNDELIEELKAWGWSTEAARQAFTHEQMAKIRTILTQKDAEVAEAFKKGEQSILNNTTVGWDIDIVQLDGTICKWRLINIYDVIPPHPTEDTSDKSK